MRIHLRSPNRLVRLLFRITIAVMSFFFTVNFTKLTRSRSTRWDLKYHYSHTLRSTFSKFLYSDCDPGMTIGIKSRGLYLSVGEFGQISTLLGTLHDLRGKCVFEVVVVGHCDEINYRTVKLLNNFRGALVLNFCTRFSRSKFRRFRSFFTKHLLVVHSTHRHFTMIDNDMIWFETPSELTNNLIERNASAFVFNAVTFKHKTWRLPDFVNRTELRTYLSAYLTPKQIETNEYLNKSRIMNNASNVEVDASFVYYDALKAKPALQFLFESINTYRFGFGDQEAYWLICILTGVPIEIDRWAAASYITANSSFCCFFPFCGCNNAQLHYDPLATTNPRLFGINLGALIEIQTNPFTKTKFAFHYLCTKLPQHYSSPETLSYTVDNYIEDCKWPGACIQHANVTKVSDEHKQVIRRRQNLHMKTMLIEWTLNDVL